MKNIRAIALGLVSVCLVLQSAVFAADHNDPNAVNSIFSDVPVSPADLYGMFGYPSDDTSNGEAVVIQLTFAPIPKTGVFDKDMLYRIKLDADTRISTAMQDKSLEGMLKYLEALKDKYFKTDAAEIKVSFNDKNQAKVDFIGFPGGDFSEVVDTNQILTLKSPDGHSIKTYLGGRDDPFFNDLPGFFRSINYGPQFYHIPVTMKKDHREFAIPKTLLELEGNTLFNFDPNNPRHGQGVKLDLPADASLTWSGDKFLKDKEGNFRFVYSGVDAQAGFNVNALIFEIPLAFITKSPMEERIVRTWGESFVLKASSLVPAYAPSMFQRFWLWLKSLFSEESEFNNNVSDYNQVDHVGVPFSDAALSEREDAKVAVNNIRYSRQFVTRFGHLGWGFGPSVSALGLPTCFKHDDSPVSVYKVPKLATAVFLHVKDCFFQELNMPDDSWKKNGVDIPLKRTFEIFVPNLTSIDMDTTGTWPFGRRPEDQVASRFLSTFLDMSSNCGGAPCNIETLGNQALWDSAPIVPKTPPNPLHNDKPFLNTFPYLAEPWNTGSNWQ